jgi:hypothetical protein
MESMKRHALSLVCLAAIAATAAGQTTTTYRGVTVREPAPYGAAGLAYQDNFKALADRIGNHIEAADDPTADDDEVGTGGEAAVMARSTWRNTSDNGVFACVDASEGAAVWAEVSTDWRSPGAIGSTTPNTGAFTTLTASQVVVSEDSTDAIVLGADDDMEMGYTGGALEVSVAKDFNVTCTDDMKFTTGVTATSNISYYVGGGFSVWSRDASSRYFFITTDGEVKAPNDNQKLTLGAAGSSDLAVWYDGTRGQVDSAGGLQINDALAVDGAIEFSPSSSETPTDDGDVTIEATNDTTLTFKLRGSDGSVRCASLTLAP